MQTTKTIKGQKITLTRGTRYRASRPMAEKGATTFPVFIREMSKANSRIPADKVLTIEGLTYNQANDFLQAFNDGYTSFDGRIW